MSNKTLILVWNLVSLAAIVSGYLNCLINGNTLPFFVHTALGFFGIMVSGMLSVDLQAVASWSQCQVRK